ncbi:hypothetical protein BD560DRAFT_388680 [Blakeslea trispora]|nr:hypothetical protein BD560DRAFT_388680 [Blakeslea trispora]
MGASISTHAQHFKEATSNTEFMSNERRRVPRHLQPLNVKIVEKHVFRTSLGKQRSVCSDKHNKVNKQQNLSTDNTSTLPPYESIRKTDELERISIKHPNASQQMFRWIRGRRFQDADSIYYPLPNDQLEIDRHQVQLYIMRWAFGNRHIVPPPLRQKLDEGIRVLNVGCGPGLWVGHAIIDMAEDFCNSTFDAVDICNLIPQYQDSDKQSQYIGGLEQEPSNLRFTLHNILIDSLPFESDTFDYVQQSITALTYKVEDWPNVLRELKRVTKPGGYIQLIENEIHPYCLGPIGESWRDQILDVIKLKRGNDPRIATRFEELLRNVDLENVTVKFVSIPIGPWGLDIGNLWKQNVYAFLESAATFLVHIMGITNSEYKERTRTFMEELDTGRYKAFSNIYVAYGRKKINTVEH